ncbi:MAG: alanyl-tRNA synthetase [Actinomycetota bacterium]
MWETDVLYPLIESARSLTGAAYKVGDYGDRDSFSLRVLAEHARSATMLVNDGVFPSNENRGYVLRRIIRRAVRHAFLLGTEKLVLPDMVRTAIGIMGNAYPDLRKNEDFIVGVVANEEDRFRHTLKTGLGILEGDISGGATLSGASAFLLHDTYGFPLELTQEIAGERGVEVDVAGFEAEMSVQRQRARDARKTATTDEEKVSHYRSIAEHHGPTDFVGYQLNECEATVIAVLPGDEHGTLEVFLDRTPFYAESGGQVGDIGSLSSAQFSGRVVDTTFAVPGVRRHVVRAESGDVVEGQVVQASIDVDARAATRRNHTGTHILHWALRTVLGEHVKQAGSLVSPDRLRFDFSHYAAVSETELRQIERLANEQVLLNDDVAAWETSKDEALAAGAIAFFGDKYGDVVRVLRAGSSVELCGGTHVSATGDIGTIKIIGESSIGSNLRRIEATTGMNTVEVLQRHDALLTDIAGLVGGTAEVAVEAVGRKLDELKAAQDEIKQLRAKI